MITNHEQPSAMERLSAAAGNIYETIQRGINNRTAIGMSVLALAGAELATAEPTVAAGHHSQSIHFKPGHYEGTTAQTCTEEAAATKVCDEGKKIPVSFTVTKSKMLDFTSAVIDKCYDIDANPQPDKTIPLKFKSAPILAGHGFMYQKDIGGAVTEPMVGHLRDMNANGKLGAEGAFNAAGKPDINGDDLCSPSLVTWHAKRVG